MYKATAKLVLPTSIIGSLPRPAWYTAALGAQSFLEAMVNAVAGWWERFPAGVESREDTYLFHPHLCGLSVKLRAGEALEVKVYRGSPGILDVVGGLRAHR